MKTNLHPSQAALRLIAGLLFVFMGAYASTASAGPPANSWDGQPADKIENTSGGDGSTADKAILIKDAAELAYFAQQVNTGGTKLTLTNGTSIDNTGDNSKIGFAGYYFALSTDIDLAGNNWTPIGNASKRFKGHFNGNGHVVKGLKVEINSTTDYVFAGLFGYVMDGTLCNLGVRLAPEGVVAATSYQYANVCAGGIAGLIASSNANAEIRNCYVDAEGDGAVKATATDERAYAGGIVGYLAIASSNKTLTLTHCYATVDVKATCDEQAFAGGIAGSAIGSVLTTYAYTTGKVKVKGETKQFAGGICGYTSGTLTNCLALNQEISGEGSAPQTNEIHRVAGKIEIQTTLSANYATPRMQINGTKTTGSDPATTDGADTQSDTFEDNLKAEPSTGNGWDDGAWTWPAGYNLPTLNKVNADGSYGNPLGGQTSHPAINFLPPAEWKNAVADAIENQGGGTGTTINNPILIKDGPELAYLAQQVNKGESVQVGRQAVSCTSYFALSADIDLEGGNWTPIGNASKPFKGHLNGNGHVVKGLKVEMNSTTDIYAGLFGYVDDGTLCNLGVRLAPEGVVATSSYQYANVYAGGIAGQITSSNANAEIRNCYVDAEGGGTVIATATDTNESAYAGGIVGALNITSSLRALTFTHCYATVDVKATSDYLAFAGGIAGSASGVLSYAYATGKVKVKGENMLYAGGICGQKYGTLTNCLALNQEISSEGSATQANEIHRVTGKIGSQPTSSANYATPRMLINGAKTTSTDATALDGADTWLNTFRNDLSSSGSEWTNGNWNWSGNATLPQLRQVVWDQSGNVAGYADWPSPQQPTLPAADYLTNYVPPTPPPPPLPPVYCVVSVPFVDGLTTRPKAGNHLVESGYSFRLYLTLDEGYEQSEPIVTTSRGEVLRPRESDGAYVLNYILDDVSILIEGVKPNPVANAELQAGIRAWAADGRLLIRTDRPEQVFIYTFDGRQIKSLRTSAGTEAITLPPGSYIVQIADKRFKVII